MTIRKDVPEFDFESVPFTASVLSAELAFIADALMTSPSFFVILNTTGGWRRRDVSERRFRRRPALNAQADTRSGDASGSVLRTGTIRLSDSI